MAQPRGAGGQFRKATQTEALGGAGGEFARLIATMQVDDQIYREELAKLEGLTLRSARAMQGSFDSMGRTVDTTSMRMAGLGSIGKRSLTTLRSLTFLAAGEMSVMAGATFGAVGRIAALSAAFGGLSTGLAIVSGWAAAYHLNIGNARKRTDEMVQSLTDWYYGIEKLNASLARQTGHLTRQQDIMDKLKILRGELTPETARIEQLLRERGADITKLADEAAEAATRKAEEREAEARQRISRTSRTERGQFTLNPPEQAAFDELWRANLAVTKAGPEARARVIEQERKRAQEEARLEQRLTDEQARRERARESFEAKMQRARDVSFQIEKFGQKFGLFPPSMSIDAQMAALEQRSAQVFTPRFAVSARAAGQFGRGITDVTIGQQSEEAKTLKDIAKIEKEARDLLKQISDKIGFKVGP